MTGFGRSHIDCDGREMFIELKSVNHRFLDVNYRIPKGLSFLEETLREKVRQSGVRRGHLDVSITYANHRADSKAIVLDHELVMQCARETQSLSGKLQKESPSVFELIKLCDAMMITQVEEDTEAVIKLAEDAFAQAEAGLQLMREREGRILADDLNGYLQTTKTIAEQIAGLAPSVPEDYRDRLTKRLQEWNVEIADPARIAQEVAQMADRCAIDEELSRLQSHFQQFTACLTHDGETGRRMDFLLQEMNREINTIGSKASDAEIAGNVVEMKSVLEKLREQVQNVE